MITPRCYVTHIACPTSNPAWDFWTSGVVFKFWDFCFSTFNTSREAFSELQKPSPLFAYNLLTGTIFRDEYGSQFAPEKLSNDLLGVKELSHSEIKSIVEKYV
jgi:hypothetical protein